MALAYAPTTTDSTRTQHMSLTDRVRLRQLLALGMVEEVRVDGVTRYRATGTTCVRNVPLGKAFASLHAPR